MANGRMQTANTGVENLSLEILRICVRREEEKRSCSRDCDKVNVHWVYRHDKADREPVGIVELGTV